MRTNRRNSGNQPQWTPLASLACPSCSKCPGIHRNTDGSVAIIGKPMRGRRSKGLPIGEGESAIVLSADEFRTLMSQLDPKSKR